MPCDRSTLRDIYRVTRGYCHRCRRKLAFQSYARPAVRGAWAIDPCELRPACHTCLSGHVSKVRVRPLPAPPRPPALVAPLRRGCRHTLLGGLLGAFFAGPWGALLGGLLGAEVDSAD